VTVEVFDDAGGDGDDADACESSVVVLIPLGLCRMIKSFLELFWVKKKFLRRNNEASTMHELVEGYQEPPKRLFT
jgi:hypothetical protein